MSALFSNEFFHFVGHSGPNNHDANYALLKKVIQSRCVSHPPHRDDWGDVGYVLDLSKRLHFEELIVPRITCYCDIPFDSLHIHTPKYGAFGLSLSRHHLIKFGARPVTYIPVRPDDSMNSRGGGTALLSVLEASYRGLRSQLLAPNEAIGPQSLVPTQVPSTPAVAARHLNRTLALEVLAFIKPYDATLDETDPRYYYSEREWRKFGNMRFEPRDVVRVVVHPQFVDLARRELPEYGNLIHAAPVP